MKLCIRDRLINIGKRLSQKYAAQCPKVQTFTIDNVFGGWAKAQKAHFVNGAIFDQIYSDQK